MELHSKASSVIAVVAAQADPLAWAVTQRLNATEPPYLAIDPRSLASREVTLSDGKFYVEGRELSSVLWRVHPTTGLGAGYREEDQLFATQETAATWLCALRLPSVRAINAYSPTIWYGDFHWAQARLLLQADGICVSPLRYGESDGDDARWLPYMTLCDAPHPGRVVAKTLGIATTDAQGCWSELVVCGDGVRRPYAKVVRRVAAVLERHGIRLARVTFDAEDRVLRVDTMPLHFAPDELDFAADRLVAALTHLEAP